MVIADAQNTTPFQTKTQPWKEANLPAGMACDPTRFPWRPRGRSGRHPRAATGGGLMAVYDFDPSQVLQVPCARDHPADHAIGDRLLSAHPVVAVGVAVDLLKRLARLAGDNAVDSLAHF